ncbi:hypothetical protein HRG_012501 [Hirsutella rhossiliensis]
MVDFWWRISQLRYRKVGVTERGVGHGNQYFLTEALSGQWLRDISLLIKPISDGYSTIFREASRELDEEAARVQQQAVLRLDLLPLQLLQPLLLRLPLLLLRLLNVVVNCSCGPSPGPGYASCSGPGPGPSPNGPFRVKRGGFQADLPDRDEDSSKKQKTRRRNGCLACKSLGHRLSQCWQVFEENRPEGFNPSKRLQETIQQSLKEDPSLQKKIDEIRPQIRGKIVGIANPAFVFPTD